MRFFGGAQVQPEVVAAGRIKSLVAERDLDVADRTSVK
jgi:hypothetical protein